MKILDKNQWVTKRFVFPFWILPNQYGAYWDVFNWNLVGEIWPIDPGSQLILPVGHYSITRWWQLKYFLFSSLLPGEMIQFEKNMFQMGWFNHQLDHNVPNMILFLGGKRHRYQRYLGLPWQVTSSPSPVTRKGIWRAYETPREGHENVSSFYYVYIYILFFLRIHIYIYIYMTRKHSKSIFWVRCFTEWKHHFSRIRVPWRNYELKHVWSNESYGRVKEVQTKVLKQDQVPGV